MKNFIKPMQTSTNGITLPNHSAIHIEHLWKSYPLGTGKVDILKNISLTIFKKDFVSIMGPSGSGKSTLMYLMGSLDKPSSGSIWIGNKDIATMNDQEQSILRRRDIGFVFQFYNLIPNLSVEENIFLPILLDNGKIKNHEEKLTELLELVGLSHRRHHTPRELSGGQQQRVAIARALINSPEVILADEPIGNLDSKTGEDIMKLLEKLNKETGATIVQVTHSQEAAEYTPKIITVKDGVIVSNTTEKASQIQTS